ncbi:MAG: AAA family ATPase [Dermatophilaceae bacterium]
MRLHRLEVGNVKGIASGAMTFPVRGVCVLVGPNEAGKTTLMNALDLLLEEKDSSRKRHVLAMQPVGCDVASWVEAEMSAGPHRFTYRKQWFRQPSTELHVTAPAVEHLVGVAAHERVGEMLAATTDLTLWKALRLLQASPLVPPDLGGSTALSAALDAAAGSAVDAGSDGDSLVCAAESEHARYFTAGKGQPTGEFRQAIDAVEAARQAEHVAAVAMAEVTADVERHDAVRGSIRAAQQQVDEAGGHHDEIEGRWCEVAVLVDRCAAAERDADIAERDAARARERRDERDALAGELSTRQRLVAEQSEVTRCALGELTPLEERLRGLRAELRAAHQRVTVCADAAELAEREVTLARRSADATLLAERVARVDQVEEERRSASATLARLRVDDAAVRSLERLAATLDVAVSRREAESARVTLIGLQDSGAVVVVDGAEVTLRAGEELERTVAEPVDVIVPGRLIVRLCPESGAAERSAAVDAARRALREGLADVGVESLEHARRAADERRGAQDRLTRASDRLDDVLAGARREDLRDELARCADEVAELRAALDTEVGASLSPDTGATGVGGLAPGEGRAVIRSGTQPTIDAATDVTADVTADAGSGPGTGTGRHSDDLWGLDPQERARVAREELATARETYAALVQRVDAYRSGVEEARVEHTRAQSLLAAAEREMEAAEQRLARLREQEPDEQVREALRRTEGTRRYAAEAHQTLSTQVATLDPEALTLQRSSAQARLDTVQERLAGLRDERLAIEARLEFNGRQGRYDALETARGEARHAERQLAAVSRRAEAARLLHETLQAHRLDATRAYAAPFVEAIRRLGAVVYGPDFAVEVGDDLRVIARVLSGRRIDHEALSAGAREQLALLIRLAVAGLVDPREGVPVVIDDALAFTDPVRLDRMSAAFSLVGEQVQVILLTCAPGRYDGIVGACREDFGHHFRTAEPERVG